MSYTATIELDEKQIGYAQQAIQNIGLNWTMEQFIDHCLMIGFDHETAIYEPDEEA